MPDDEIVDSPETTESTVEEDTTTETSGNPNWNELLGAIPDNLHHLVTPHLTKWDQGVQQRFQKIQSESEGYAPYKDIVEQGLDPQQIQQAMSVMAMLNDKPDQFYKEMQAFYKDDPRFISEQVDPNDSSQGQESYEEGSQPQQFNIETDPRFKQLQEQQEIIANFLSQQVRAEEEAKEDAALSSELDSLTEKYGEYDLDYVLGLAKGDIDLEVAVQRYKAMETKFRNTPTPGSNLPSVVPPGGGVPSTAIDPSSMNSHDTRNLIAEYLATQER